MATTTSDYAIHEGASAFSVFPIIDGKTRKGIKIASFPYETSPWASINRELAAHNAYLFVNALVEFANNPDE